jgi:hypothetical protein
VDFVVVRDGKPWFLVEAKAGDDKLSPALKHFQDQIKAPFAFQVLLDADFVKADCLVSKRCPSSSRPGHCYRSCYRPSL